MTATLLTSTLRKIADVVHRESGMLLREPQLDALAGAIDRIDPAGDLEAFLDNLADPVSGPGHLSRLLDEVTVKETFFLRDARQLGEIDWHLLLAHARTRGSANIRVWSVGCATGEEAYSLALLACEAFGAFAPPLTILATDISRLALARAGEGDYRPRSTRDLDPVTRQRYFREEGDRLVVGDPLRALVTFARHNVVRDPVPPLGETPFDLILCRNVLIYFDRETVDRVIARLESALASSGTLVLGAADALCRGAGALRALLDDAAVPEPVKPSRTRMLRRPLGRVDPPGGAARSEEPLDGMAHFLRGLAELETANLSGAIAAFRASLYADPGFGLAAFQLGRTYEAIGNGRAARRAYEQALATLEPDPDVHDALIDQIDLDDVKAAARSRLEFLALSK